MIAGFEEPDAGRVLLDGEDVTHVSPKRRNVNMVFQDYALFPHMTVAENVGFGLRLKRVGARARSRARVAEMLDRRPARRPRRTAARPSSPAASASGSPSPAPWSTAPRRCCSTSRSARST